MLNRIYIFLVLMLTLVFFQSCDEDEWVFDIPGCMNQNATNYDSHATSDNGSCYYYTLPLFDLNATSYHDWIYFSLSSGEIVDDMTEQESSDSNRWDLAFKRNHIKTNSGLSGTGDVCAIVDDTQLWTYDSFQDFQDTSQIPNITCQADVEIAGIMDLPNNNCQGCYSQEAGHNYLNCIKNPALDLWGSFFDCFNFKVSNYQFFVMGMDGNYFKIWLMDYEDTNGDEGKITMAYQTIQ